MTPPASQATVTLSQIAELAGVGASAVSNWRKRFDDFPAPVEVSPDGRDAFSLPAVVSWLEARDRLPSESSRERLVFEAGEAIRAAAPTAQYEELVAATLALAYALESLQADKAPVSGDPVASVEAADPNLAGVFGGLAELGPKVVKRLLSLVDVVPPAERLETFEWVLGRRSRFDDVTTGKHRAAALRTFPGDGEAIFDPAAGEGTLLIPLGGRNPESLRYGQEVNPAAWRVAKQRFLLAQLDVDMWLGDSLVNDAFPDLRVPVVLCDPPYNTKNPLPASALAEGRWNSAVVRARSADYAWLQHAIQHLTDEGRAYVLLPLGSLFRGGAEQSIRAEMIRRGEVEAVISLPPEPSTGSSIGVALWVLRRAVATHDSEPVLLVDLGEWTPGPLDDTVSTLFVEIHMALDQWRKTHELQPYNRENATAVPVVDLLAADANLSPSRWIAEPVVNLQERERQLARAIEQFELARADLVSSLPELSTVVRVRPVRWVTVHDLVDSGVGTVIRGVPRSAPSSNAEVTQTLPLLTARDLTQRRFGSDVEQRIDIGQMTRPPAVTKAGDIVLAPQGGGIRAIVDTVGGHVLAQPLQALRLSTDWLDPHLAAAFLEAPRNRRFLRGSAAKTFRLRDLELPVLDAASAARLRDTFHQLRRAQTEAHEVADYSAEVHAALISYVEASQSEDDSL